MVAVDSEFITGFGFRDGNVETAFAYDITETENVIVYVVFADFEFDTLKGFERKFDFGLTVLRFVFEFGFL